MSAGELFAVPPHRAKVVVKKARLPAAGALAHPAGSPAPEREADPGAGGRPPRVFLVARPDAPAAAGSTEATAVPAAPAPGPRRRPRRLASVQRPGEVVLITPPPADARPDPEAPQPAAEALPEPAFSLSVPGHQAHRAVMAALEQIRALVDDAVAASRLRFSPEAAAAGRRAGRRSGR